VNGLNACSLLGMVETLKQKGTSDKSIFIRTKTAQPPRALAASTYLRNWFQMPCRQVTVCTRLDKQRSPKLAPARTLIHQLALTASPLTTVATQQYTWHVSNTLSFRAQWYSSVPPALAFKTKRLYHTAYLQPMLRMVLATNSDCFPERQYGWAL
jgi:hypothetical protein